MQLTPRRVAPLAERWGRAARKRGWPHTRNPYKRDVDNAHKHYAWLRGWQKQRAAELREKKSWPKLSSV